MTVHEEHLAAVKAEDARHRAAIDDLRADLQMKQDECSHRGKWGPRDENMFYAMGETAPGKQCTECGAKKHVDRR